MSCDFCGYEGYLVRKFRRVSERLGLLDIEKGEFCPECGNLLWGKVETKKTSMVGV